MVQVFLKKWWVESDFKAPNLPFSLRLKDSGCHYNSIYNIGKIVVKAVPISVKEMSKTLLCHTLIKKIFLTFLLTSLSLYIFTIWKCIVYYRLCRDGIYFDKILVSEYKLFKRSNKANLFIDWTCTEQILNILNMDWT